MLSDSAANVPQISLKYPPLHLAGVIHLLVLFEVAFFYLSHPSGLSYQQQELKLIVSMYAMVQDNKQEIWKKLDVAQCNDL